MEISSVRTPSLHHRLHSAHWWERERAREWPCASVSPRSPLRLSFPRFHFLETKSGSPRFDLTRPSPSRVPRTDGHSLDHFGVLARAEPACSTPAPPSPAPWGYPAHPELPWDRVAPRLAPPPLPDARAASGSVASAHRRACAAIGSAGCPSPPLRPGGRFSQRSRSPGGSGAARSADRGGHGPARASPCQQPSHGGRELGDALLRPGLGHVVAGGAPRSPGAAA